MISKVLLVEDDESIANLIILHLKNLGYDVTHASEYREGLELALNESFSLILLDLMLPDGNAVTGDITASLKLYDSGTEVDEYAGAGNNQAPRQAGPNTGVDENGTVEEETAPSSNVPNLSDYIKVTIIAN